MRKHFVLVLCLVFAMAEAAALNFDEKIDVKGGGSLISETNSDNAKDSVHGTGVQKYTRNVSHEENSASLTSIYHLNKSNNSGGRPNFRSFEIKTNPNAAGKDGWTPYSYSELSNQNSYTIQMKSPNRLQHGVTISGSNDIDSNSKITFKEGKVETKYNLSGSGVLNEAVVDFGTRRKPNFIAETRINDTNFSLTSGLGDSALMGSEIDALIQWARTVDAGPKSVSSTKKVDPENGVVGKPNDITEHFSTQPGKDDGTGASGSENPTNQAGSDSGAGRQSSDNVKGNLSTIPKDDPASPVTVTPTIYFGNQTENKFQERLGTKSVPNTNGDDKKKSDSEKSSSNNPGNAAILVMESKDHSIPTAFIGKVAQFDYSRGLWETTKNTTGEDYNASYERGMRIVKMNECNSPDGLCQNYTYISAAYRYGDPKPWVSPYAQLDKLLMPPSL